MTSEQHEAALREWRRMTRKVEHARSQALVDNPGVDKDVVLARFAVENRDDLDHLAELAADVDAERVRLEQRLASSVEGVAAWVRWQQDYIEAHNKPDASS